MGIEGTLAQLLDESLEHLSELVLAVVLLAVGVLLGWLLRWVAEVLLRNLGLDGFAERSGLARALKGATRMEYTLSQLVGRIVFWTVFLLFLASALETVGLAQVAGFLTAVARFLPKVLGAVLLTIGGLFAGRLVREMIVEGEDHQEAPEAWQRLGRGAQIAVVAAAVLLSLILLGMDLTALFWLMAVAIAVSGLVVAVGWGPVLHDRSRGQMVARRLRAQLKEGDLVRVGETEGFVVTIGDAYLTLQTTEGMVYLPHDVLVSQPLAVITTLPESDLASLEVP